MVLQILAVPSVLMIRVDFVFEENESLLTILKRPTNYNQCVLTNRTSASRHFLFKQFKWINRQI